MDAETYKKFFLQGVEKRAAEYGLEKEAFLPMVLGLANSMFAGPVLQRQIARIAAARKAGTVPVAAVGRVNRAKAVTPRTQRPVVAPPEGSVPRRAKNYRATTPRYVADPNAQLSTGDKLRNFGISAAQQVGKALTHKKLRYMLPSNMLLHTAASAPGMYLLDKMTPQQDYSDQQGYQPQQEV